MLDKKRIPDHKHLMLIIWDFNLWVRWVYYKVLRREIMIKVVFKRSFYHSMGNWLERNIDGHNWSFLFCCPGPERDSTAYRKWLQLWEVRVGKFGRWVWGKIKMWWYTFGSDEWVENPTNGSKLFGLNFTGNPGAVFSIRKH